MWGIWPKEKPYPFSHPVVSSAGPVIKSSKGVDRAADRSAEFQKGIDRTVIRIPNPVSCECQSMTSSICDVTGSREPGKVAEETDMASDLYPGETSEFWEIEFNELS